MSGSFSQNSLFDAHLHIIDPAYPLIPNQGFTPEAFTVADYRNSTQGLDIIGGAVISGSFQGPDQEYLIAALKALGEGFVGVTQLPPDITDDEIRALHEAGVRAVRFNLYRGDNPDTGHIETLANRVWELCQWHSEFYLDSTRLNDLAPLLAQLPLIAVDHLGLSEAGLPALRAQMELGCFVKATGFMRCDFHVPPVLAQLYETEPSRLIWGSDLPGTRAPRQFGEVDILMLEEALAPAALSAVLSENARWLYLERFQA